MNYYGLHGWGMTMVWVVAILLFIIIAWLVIRTVGQHRAIGRRPKKRVLEILEERYAKGEIDKKELEEKKRDLDL
ncbi:MAG: SHOCT domain-containing protein [Candidatus Marinimicrobia bacterium]|nr:SHOCT domain-containing protein [Candidatus Neomarinimicrobiota bacterium]